MSDQKSKPTVRHCTFCGEVVTDRDYDYIGSARIWICGSAACDREANDAHRQAREEAQYEADRDGYERYM